MTFGYSSRCHQLTDWWRPCFILSNLYICCAVHSKPDSETPLRPATTRPRPLPSTSSARMSPADAASRCPRLRHCKQQHIRPIEVNNNLRTACREVLMILTYTTNQLLNVHCLIACYRFTWTRFCAGWHRTVEATTGHLCGWDFAAIIFQQVITFALSGNFVKFICKVKEIV